LPFNLQFSILLLCLIPFSLRSAQSLPFSDAFTNADGNLYTVASGVWDGAGNGGPELTISSGAALSSPSGLLAASAKGVHWAPSGTARRAGVLFNAVTTSSVYVSFLVDVQVAPSAAKLMAFLENSSSSTTSPQLGIYVNAGPKIGIGKKASSPAVESGPLSPGSHLVVVRYSFLTGNDQADLWVDPSASTLGAANPPGSIGATTGASDPAGISYFQINCPSGAGPSLNLDEVRIGTSWADVTPPAAVPPSNPPPYFTHASVSSQSVTLRGSNGPASGPYTLLFATNLALPVTQWSIVSTSSFDFAGGFACTNPIAPGSAHGFYRLAVGLLGPPGALSPYIINQPQSQEAALGSNVTFAVNAGGTAPLTYLWYFQTNSLLTNSPVPLVTLTSVSSNQAGAYSVVITNSAGSVTSSVVFLTIAVPPTNGDFYVSPSGNDSNSGTFAAPFFTLAKAVSLASAGSMIYLRGGTYFYTQTIRIDTPGSPTNRTKVWAYPGEHPILDFTNQPYASANRAILLTTNANCWHFKGLEIANAGDNGMKIEGSSNIVEQCLFHHCGDTGLQIGFAHETVNPGNLGAYNYILNCDSHDNFDFDNAGSDADGFACKLHPGYGNVFSGCRSWNNADDGWDLFESDHTVTITNCWQWHSGDKTLFDAIYLAKMGHAMSSYQGNGNGFKLGGNGAGGSSEGTHIVRNCVAFNNHFPGRTAHGFDQNSHHGGVIVYNCVSFSNLYNYFFEDSAGSNPQIFHNDVSFAPSGSGSGVSDFGSGSIVDHNSWDLTVTANSSDFTDLSEAAAAAPRQPDGSLPTGFARLVSGSDLIDKGSDVGIPYSGAAPDLGAFEFLP
jgi:hypothetical protein